MRPLERLRDATREVHERLEAAPYAQAVLGGEVCLEQYQSFLRALYVVHTAVEDAIEASGRADLRSTFGTPAERREQLERDLRHLGVDPYGVDAPALQALVFAQQVRLAATRDPDQLFGYLYVLEGSQLGGLVQHKALAKLPALREGGLSYLRGAGGESRENFERFVVRLESALRSEAMIEGAVRGAIHAFVRFEELMFSLTPETRHRSLVAELNFDAGSHSVPDDVREVEAALRAGEESYHAFAYYSQRYGERGLRFTRSDSAWLATLARADTVLARRHVFWVARVLAARGMPRLLLELHLQVLEARLTQRLPERAASYASLGACAAELRQERIAAIPEARAEAVRATFVRTRQAEHGMSPEEAATLIVAAAADERCKIPGAVASLEAWLADSKHFSSDWVAAVRRTISAARALS